MQIITGKIKSAQKVVVYGPEGIGKSTLASQFPKPVFIDTEGSTKKLDVARTPRPSSWTMLMEQVKYFKTEKEYKTLIVDTADWAEQLCIENICATNHKKGIEDFGYGKGYTYLMEEFGRFLNLLEDVVESGMNVVLTAHARMRKFEQPDEMGAYDRWELKLQKQTAPLVKEWADMVLFANYETMVINVDGQGAQKGKNKAQGGKRVIYTSHHPCWDAKNRDGLPEKIPMDYSAISHLFEEEEEPVAPAQQTIPEKEPDPVPEKEPPVQPPQENYKPQGAVSPDVEKNEAESFVKEYDLDSGTVKNPHLIKPLRDLMNTYGVDEWTLQTVVSQKGYYPIDTPIEKWEEGFMAEVLVAAWDQVYKEIKQLGDEIPFN